MARSCRSGQLDSTSNRDCIQTEWTVAIPVHIFSHGSLTITETVY